MGEKISVVIPVYKVEAYLAECLDSVINQTYRNLEIILVDDASPDGSGEICDRYAEKDARIRSVHLEKNRGQAAARNEGMELATGGYLFFADSDDRLAEYALEKLYEGLKKHTADCSVGILTVYDGKTGNSIGKGGRPGKAGRCGRHGQAGNTGNKKQWDEHCETAQEAMERVF